MPQAQSIIRGQIAISEQDDGTGPFLVGFLHGGDGVLAPEGMLGFIGMPPDEITLDLKPTYPDEEDHLGLTELELGAFLGKAIWTLPTGRGFAGQIFVRRTPVRTRNGHDHIHQIIGKLRQPLFGSRVPPGYRYEISIDPAARSLTLHPGKTSLARLGAHRQSSNPDALLQTPIWRIDGIEQMFVSSYHPKLCETANRLNALIMKAETGQELEEAEAAEIIHLDHLPFLCRLVGSKGPFYSDAFFRDYLLTRYRSARADWPAELGVILTRAEMVRQSLLAEEAIAKVESKMRKDTQAST